MIDISDLTPAAALAALYNASRPQGMGFLAFKPGDMTEKEAADVLRGSRYVDYLDGRVIKCDFGDGPRIDPRLFDRDNGPGAAQRAIDAWRRQAKQAAKAG